MLWLTISNFIISFTFQDKVLQTKDNKLGGSNINAYSPLYAQVFI